MRELIAIALLLVISHAAVGEQLIDVQHDSVHSVTCWIITAQGGISCLPDNQLRTRATATPSSEAVRASQASSASKNQPLQATPAPGDERFQL